MSTNIHTLSVKSRRKRETAANIRRSGWLFMSAYWQHFSQLQKGRKPPAGGDYFKVDSEPSREWQVLSNTRLKYYIHCNLSRRCVCGLKQDGIKCVLFCFYLGVYWLLGVILWTSVLVLGFYTLKGSKLARVKWWLLVYKQVTANKIEIFNRDKCDIDTLDFAAFAVRIFGLSGVVV